MENFKTNNTWENNTWKIKEPVSSQEFDGEDSDIPVESGVGMLIAALEKGSGEKFDAKVCDLIKKVRDSDDPRRLAEFATNEHWAVRCVAALNGETRTETLKKLTEDADGRVRDITFDMLEKRTVECADHKFFLSDMFSANCPTDRSGMLGKLIEDDESGGYITRIVLRNRAILSEILVEHLDDKNEYTRAVALEALENRKKDSPDTPADRSPAESDVESRLAAAKSCRTPVEELNNLADDKNEEVRFLVAHNIMTSPETLIKLADDKDERVCIAVALRADTPPEALIKLAEHESKDIRIIIVLRNDTPSEVLALLVKDEVLAIRFFLVKHKNTPIDTLMLLADEDEDDEISFIAEDRVDSLVTSNPDALVDSDALVDFDATIDSERPVH